MGDIISNSIQTKNISYELLKYIKPIWYFHLKPYDRMKNIWVEYNLLTEEEKKIITYDTNYSNEQLSDWDASFQAVLKGIVKLSNDNNQIDNIRITSKDIYRFSRKYYNKVWVYLIFLQRILIFNPIKEIIGLWKTKDVKKCNIFGKCFTHNEYDNYDSCIVNSNPLISIIIPTYNRYEELRGLLKDLELQIYKNFELIIIDQSDPFNRNFYAEFKILHNVVRQKDPGLWKARNKGISLSKSEYLIFLDDDSRIERDWIFEHLKCLDYFNADISSGVSISAVGGNVPKNYFFFRWSDQLDTGNTLIRKVVFQKSGLFDEQFENMRMGDGEFGVRAYLHGFKNISNHKASRKHLKIAKGGLRDIGHWDAFRSRKILSPRPIPSVLYYWRKYWGNKGALLNSIITIPFSLTPYRYKSNKVYIMISLLLFILIFPFIIIQVSYSWYLSTKMINKDAIINKL